MNEDAKHVVAELKQKNYLDELYKQNTIEFDHYFKYSGRIEEDQSLITYWEYDVNHKVNKIHEHFKKIKKYEKD